jgi:hypothetical protein
LEGQSCPLMESKMKACKFTFDDEKVWSGFACGTTWNGFDNVAVTKEIAAEIDRYFEGQDCAISEIEPDKNGLISLANGFATQIVYE